MDKNKTLLKKFSEEIRKNPNSATAFYNRGVIYDQIKDYEKAIEDLTMSLTLSPSFARPYNNRGNIYYKLKNYIQAEKDFSKAIELDKNYVLAYTNRSLNYNFMRKFDEALIDCEKALSIDPNCARAYNVKGIIYLETAKYKQSITNFLKSLNLEYQSYCVNNLRICFNKANITGLDWNHPRNVYNLLSSLQKQNKIWEFLKKRGLIESDNKDENKNNEKLISNNNKSNNSKILVASYENITRRIEASSYSNLLESLQERFGIMKNSISIKTKEDNVDILDDKDFNLLSDKEKIVITISSISIY